ncbi:hypothetical protein GCM10009571_09140 [Agromyces luteolus]|uniref:Uncharacterized protein n=1 Tax=Agromyces luteolus TaxID=88373 RepID=A0A7C9LIC1_9MICO|nr:hypothetical protein [Agromyces luteolus]MUN07794.1 hypothetical protein [Agromyces luteolus]
MDLAHGFLAQQMTAHDQRHAEFATEGRSSAAERRDLARAERASRTARRAAARAGLRARLHHGEPRSAH